MQACGKSYHSASRGSTATGYNLSGMSWNEAKTVAIDPRYIPLGSKLLIIFNDNAHKKYSGIYTARDTGGAIKGKKIDFYFGDFGSSTHKETEDFGVAHATVYLLK